MFLFVGLGNPGAKYESTRHNIGFETIDYIARHENLKLSYDKKHKADMLKTRLYGSEVILAKPQTYMNLSGESVSSIANYYDIPLEHIYIIYDDIDLDVGTLRIRKSGSAGTHNGMRNIVLQLGSDKFPRLRLGIGKDPRIPLEKYVLCAFQKNEIADIEAAIIKCSEALKAIITDGLDYAMNHYNEKSKS